MTQQALAQAADPAKREYAWSLVAAIVLSCATLASAWCGFQASSWGSVYSSESRTAASLRVEANRLEGIANRQMSNDVLLFTSWVEAEVTGEQQFADELALRFQPHFTAAFDVWLSGPVTHGSLPDGSPFDLTEYVRPAQAEADETSALIGEATARADEASSHSGRYVLSTVLYASVLFLAGIASKLSHPRLTHAVVVVAGISLAGAVIVMALLPVKL